MPLSPDYLKPELANVLTFLLNVQRYNCGTNNELDCATCDCQFVLSTVIDTFHNGPNNAAGE